MRKANSKALKQRKNFFFAVKEKAALQGGRS